MDAIENQLLRLKDLGSNFLKSAMEEAFTPLDAQSRSGLPGVAAVVEPAQDRYAAIDILILRPDQRKIDSHFLAYFINARASQGRIKGMRNGVAQSHVGLTSIAKLPVKVPSLPMQRKIVEWLDGAKMRSEKFVALAERGLRNCAQMRRAILAEAFR